MMSFSEVGSKPAEAGSLSGTGVPSRTATA